MGTAEMVPRSMIKGAQSPWESHSVASDQQAKSLMPIDRRSSQTINAPKPKTSFDCVPV